MRDLIATLTRGLDRATRFRAQNFQTGESLQFVAEFGRNRVTDGIVSRAREGQHGQRVSA